MTTEGTGWGKFAQFMTYHVLGYVNRYELIAVVHTKSETYKVGSNCTGTRPSFNYRLAATALSVVNTLSEFVVNERGFFKGPAHGLLISFFLPG